MKLINRLKLQIQPINIAFHKHVEKYNILTDLDPQQLDLKINFLSLDLLFLQTRPCVVVDNLYVLKSDVMFFISKGFNILDF